MAREADLVIGIAARWPLPGGRDLDAVEQRLGGGRAEPVGVAEDVQAAEGYLAAGRGAVVLEHQGESAPEHLQVRAGDAGAGGERGAEVAASCVQAIRDGV